MSITRAFEDCFELECDRCGVSEEFCSFDEALDFKRDRSNGWRSTNETGEWEDLCPDCVEGRGRA